MIWIDHNHFLKVWQHSVEWKVEKLFVEILAIMHINLTYPYSAFIVIENLGARILLYYATLEGKWLLKSQFHVNAERRKVTWHEYNHHITSQFYSWPLSHLQQ